MKIKPSTFFLVLAALLLGGVVLVVQQQPAPKSADSSVTETEAEEKPIFEFQEADVQTVALQTQLRSLKFERDKDGKWQMLEPDKTPADDASVAFLLDLIASGKTSRTLTAPATDREQFGFHQPLATIEVTLKNKETHKLILGEYDFNRSYIYAQADPPAETADQLNVSLVSPNFENAVNRPLAEWKQPPPAKKSSSPSPTDSPAPDSKTESETKTNSDTSSPDSSDTASPSSKTSDTETNPEQKNSPTSEP